MSEKEAPQGDGVSSETGKSTHHETFAAFRKRLVRFLVNYTLVESLENFSQAHEPYPFVNPTFLRPGSVGPSYEYHMHKNALIVLMDGYFPKKLRKHFRCRDINRVRKANILDVAPDLTTLEGMPVLHRYSNQPGFEQLMRALIPLDFALLIQKARDIQPENDLYEITHFHVKIERLMDNALRSLGVDLNYLERNLYEKGDAFVETLEKKYFEYFNFYHNAAGRRSAAALAAQILAKEKMATAVFITSQQDRRFSLFTADAKSTNIQIEQYILLELNVADTKNFIAWGAMAGLNIEENFQIDCREGKGVYLFRGKYEHTEAGLPSPGAALKPGINSKEKWVRLVKEEILSMNPEVTESILFPIVYRSEIPWTELTPHAQP